MIGFVEVFFAQRQILIMRIAHPTLPESERAQARRLEEAANPVVVLVAVAGGCWPIGGPMHGGELRLPAGGVPLPAAAVRGLPPPATASYNC